jgi:hypothetical protein
MNAREEEEEEVKLSGKKNPYFFFGSVDPIVVVTFVRHFRPDRQTCSFS